MKGAAEAAADANYGEDFQEAVENNEEEERNDEEFNQN